MENLLEKLRLEQARARLHLENMASLAREIERMEEGAMEAVVEEFGKVEESMDLITQTESPVLERAKLVEKERMESEDEVAAFRRAEVALGRDLSMDNPDPAVLAKDVRTLALVSLRHLRNLDRRLELVKEEDRRKREDPSYPGPERRVNDDRRSKDRD